MIMLHSSPNYWVAKVWWQIRRQLSWKWDKKPETRPIIMESIYKQKQKKIRRKIKDWDHLAKVIVGKDAPRNSFWRRKNNYINGHWSLKSKEKQRYLINSNIQIERWERSCKWVENSTRDIVVKFLNGKEVCQTMFNNTFSISAQVVKQLLRSIMNMEWLKGRCVAKQEKAAIQKWCNQSHKTSKVFSLWPQWHHKKIPAWKFKCSKTRFGVAKQIKKTVSFCIIVRYSIVNATFLFYKTGHILERQGMRVVWIKKTLFS